MIAIKHKETGEVLLDVDAESLAGHSFVGAKLSGADFASMHLQSADFHNADLRGADFSGANLEEANMQSAVISGANFDNADLSRADLTDVVAKGASFLNAKLVRAVCRYGKFPECTFMAAEMTGADFSMSDLRGNLNDAVMHQCDLRGSDLTAANLTGVDFSRSNMFDAKITDAQMTRVNMEGAIGPHGQRVGERATATPGKTKRSRAWWQFWG